MEQMKNFYGGHKRKLIVLFILAFAFAGILLFVKNDYFLYKDTIIRAIGVQEEQSGDGPAGTQYVQNVTAVIMNGENKGEIIDFENTRTSSGMGVDDYNIRPGGELIVNWDGSGSVDIISFKRDFILALQLLLFCYVLIAVASKKSLLILAAAVLNIVILALVMFFRGGSFNIFPLFIAAAVLFTVTTLRIIGGRNKKTVAAIISTLASITAMMALAMAVFAVFTNDIPFETMEFSEFLPDYRDVFYSGVLIGGLGAIMDITIIMSSSINELIRKDPEISTERLKKSAWEIAGDIMGTMMNVLFFSGIVGSIPVIIYLVMNGAAMSAALANYGSAEVIRALVGAVGVALAVPISYLVNIWLRRGLKKDASI